MSFPSRPSSTATKKESVVAARPKMLSCYACRGCYTISDTKKEIRSVYTFLDIGKNARGSLMCCSLGCLADTAWVDHISKLSRFHPRVDDWTERKWDTWAYAHNACLPDYTDFMEEYFSTWWDALEPKLSLLATDAQGISRMLPVPMPYSEDELQVRRSYPRYVTAEVSARWVPRVCPAVPVIATSDEQE
jgi:hypothetical protein